MARAGLKKIRLTTPISDADLARIEPGNSV